MTDIHFEPFLYLAGLTHDDALIAWGGFFFRDPDRDGEDWRIVEDPELERVVGERRHGGSIGATSKPFGTAEVRITECASGSVVAVERTSDANHVWVRGLKPDTDYRYRVLVDGEPWAEGERRDWADDPRTGRRDLEPLELAYDTRFRTFPAPDTRAPLRFAVMGDYGIGILASGGAGDRQRRLGAALENAVDHAGVRLVLTTGDNIYLGDDDTVAGTGDHDDDWYFSYYEPYRYAISRVPVYPSVGNHDSDDTEASDDRDQLADNLFTDVRFAEGAETGRSSVDAGLYYRFQYGSMVEFVSIDTTMASTLETKHFFEHPDHRRFLEQAFPEAPGQNDPPWRIPFSHHPPYCAGPSHPNHDDLIRVVVPLLRRAGVRSMFCGHEHNFQHSRVDGIDYFVTGAGGKLRPDPPTRFAEAHTKSWAAEGHFLIVDVDENAMTIHPVTDVDHEGRFTYLRPQMPDGSQAPVPIVVPLTSTTGAPA